MHIPDGVLTDPKTLAAGWLGAGSAIGYAVRTVRTRDSEGRLVLMAVLAALVFALQMLNFPLPGGVSGHFAGGAATAIVLGPWPAVIVMSTVLLVQALLFTDGGLLAYGANAFNLAVVGVFTGWAVYALSLRIFGERRRLVAAFAAGWVSVVAASLAAAAEIIVSQRVPAGLVLGGIAFWHALIGIGEGAITAGLLGFLARVRPDLSGPAAEARPSGSKGAAVLAFAALLAACLSFLASAFPDGLEHVLGLAGVRPPAAGPRGLLPDYALPGVSDPRLAGVLAGVLGALLTGAALYASLRPSLRKTPRHARDTGIHRHEHRHEAEPAHAHPHHHAAPPAHGHSHGTFFERYTYILSPVHSLDPRMKVVATLAFVAAVVAASPLQLPQFVGATVVLLAITLLARLPLRHVLARSAVVLPFAGMLAVTFPLRHLGRPAETLAGLRLPAGSGAALAVLATAWLSGLTVVLLSASTPVPKLFAGLRRLRLPRVMLMLLSFMYRYAAVLGAQLTSLRRSLDSRAPRLTGLHRLRLYGGLAGSMFLRAYERGERVHAAMLSRGYDGTIPSTERLRFAFADLVAVSCVVLAMAALLAY